MASSYILDVSLSTDEVTSEFESFIFFLVMISNYDFVFPMFSKP